MAHDAAATAADGALIQQTVKKLLIILVNTVLVLVIAGVILATWMPAIYTSEWFNNADWPAVYRTALRYAGRGLIGLLLVAAVAVAVWLGVPALVNQRRQRRAETPVTPAVPPSRGFPSR